LEQVHVRGLIRRGLRLELVAGLGIALAMPALAMAADSSRSLTTQTAMTAETRDQGGRTKATVAITVSGEDGLPATGAVAITDHGKPVAGAALSAKGQVQVVVSLPAGSHSLKAVYQGDATHQSSTSVTSAVEAQTSTTPGYGISIAPISLSLTAGESGSVVVSVTPQNAAALTAPMFVTLSCSGLPDQSTCTFTPENVEILPAVERSSTVSWAILFPGALGLIGLAWGGRRRRWLSRLSLIALVGLVTMMGTTACAPRYNYYNHGPIPNPATPSGTYTVSVNAQSTDGITANTQNATMALTVK
jgi:hypothetical protein